MKSLFLKENIQQQITIIVEQEKSNKKKSASWKILWV